MHCISDTIRIFIWSIHKFPENHIPDIGNADIYPFLFKFHNLKQNIFKEGFHICGFSLKNHKLSPFELLMDYVNLSYNCNYVDKDYFPRADTVLRACRA